MLEAKKYKVLNISVVTPKRESQANHQKFRELHQSSSLFLCLNRTGLHGSVKEARSSY